MVLLTALKKISKRRKFKSYYNSDYILTVKEKQTIIISGFIIIFPLIITTILILSN